MVTKVSFLFFNIFFRGLKKGTRSRSEEGGRRLKTKLEDGDRLKPLLKSISQEVTTNIFLFFNF